MCKPLRHHMNAFLLYVIINHHWFGSDLWFVSYRSEMPLQREEVKVSGNFFFCCFFFNKSCSNRMLRLKPRSFTVRTIFAGEME